MAGDLLSAGRAAARRGLGAALGVALLLGALSLRAAVQKPRAEPEQGEQPLPALRFWAGQTLHYQIDFRTDTTSHASGAVEDPQGASEIGLAVGLLVRLDVLSTLPAAASGTVPELLAAGERKKWRARLRATYEKAAATVRGDSYDPAAGNLEAQYRALAGRSVEFTLHADGTVDEVTGLDDVLHDERATAAVRNWLSQFAAGLDSPHAGGLPGATWVRERAMSESPLKDTVLSTNSSYERNENCREIASRESQAGAAEGAPSDSPERCAVIVTHYEMKQRGSDRKPGRDATPDSLRRRGLRSAGTWTSEGESLAYVSLVTGLAVSVTQSGTEEMNMAIGRAAGGVPFKYFARIQSETHITLVPDAVASR